MPKKRDNKRNTTSNNENEITSPIAEKIVLWKRNIVDRILNTLKNQLILQKEIHLLYKKASQIAMEMENFCIREENMLKKNEKLFHEKKIKLQEIHKQLDEFVYERNDLEEMFLNINQDLELAIDHVRDDEDRENLLQKLDEFKSLFYKIYKDTDRVYKTYEYFARNFYRLTMK